MAYDLARMEKKYLYLIYYLVRLSIACRKKSILWITFLVTERLYRSKEEFDIF